LRITDRNRQKRGSNACISTTRQHHDTRVVHLCKTASELHMNVMDSVRRCHLIVKIQFQHSAQLILHIPVLPSVAATSQQLVPRLCPRTLTLEWMDSLPPSRGHRTRDRRRWLYGPVHTVGIGVLWSDARWLYAAHQVTAVHESLKSGEQLCLGVGWQ
jgi:hypothetical protein